MSFENNESPGRPTELVSVVIVNYNRRDDLRAAIQSVVRQDYPRIEVIVVDNDSRDQSDAMVRSEFPDVKLIALEANIGMDGYSTGFRQARGDYVFQMDNDSEMPDPRVLSDVVRRFKQGSANLAVVATRVEEYHQGADDINALRKRDLRCGPLNLRHFHSGGVGFRRSCLDKVGYYNQDVFLYGAELFLEIKFLAAGYSILTYPEILMLHKASPVSRSGRFLYYTIRNHCWYWRYCASRWQIVRYIPAMLLYDLGQAIWKRSLVVYFKAMRDGLGRLPKSLRPPLRSTCPDFVARIDEIGSIFRVRRTFARVFARLAGKRALAGTRR